MGVAFKTMRHLFDLFERFRADERGAFAIIFGLMAIVLFALAGAVVDFVSLQQARNRAQVALDAATLALQPEIFKAGTTAEDIAIKAQALIRDRIGDPRVDTVVDPKNIIIDTDSGSLYIEAGLVVPTIFVQLVGVDTLPATILAEATRKKLAVEVVMVLDNSGSMASSNRMNSLKGAATCATNILFLGSCVQGGSITPAENVKMSIVPFTSLVNVGAGYANATWIDQNGDASKSNDNFDDDDDESTPFPDPDGPVAGGVDRLGLFAGLSNVSWKGCVEAREYPHSVSDTEPTSSDPDTLFTPAFAPDEPDTGSFYNNYLSDRPAACTVRTCAVHSTRTCNWWGCTSWVPLSYTQTVGTTTTTSMSSCLTGGPLLSRSPTNPTTSKTETYSLLSERELQERICKYTGSASGLNNYLKGPNAGCPDASIMPLTEQRQQVIQAIAAMQSEGGTNIHQGAIWGFHVLSPMEPFTQGSPYDEATTKTMILMTDGENTFYTADNMNNAYFNQAYGFPYNEREGNMSSTDVSMATRMNQLLLETCNNAKAAGITIYTIGLEPPNQATIDVLTNCATGPGYVHFPRSASDLDEVFAEIAEQLAQLRLAR